jgi:hypothetical protein
MLGRLAPWLSGLLLLSSACKSREDPGATGTKVTAESEYDATEPVVDDNYRFRLVAPRPGWKLLHTVDIRQLVPDGVAGLMGPDGEFGGVIVEKAPGITLAQGVELIKKATPQAIIESEQDLEFEGLPARRLRSSVVLEGSNYSYQHMIFVREGYLYQIIGWGLATQVEFAELDPIFTAFSLTEGKIQGPADDRPPITHADGVGWQIRAGQYQSVISGLAVEPSEGWRFLVGRELEQTNLEAELALMNQEHGAYIAVVSERYGGPDPGGLVGLLRTNYLQNLGPAEVETTRSVAGHAVDFSRHRSHSLEFLVGIFAAEGALVQLMAWYPEASRESAITAVESLLENVTKLSEAQRQALAEQLAARKGVIRKVGATSAFLSDEFRDFAHMITWTMPRGIYDVHIGDELLDKPNVVLGFESPLEAVYADLEVFEGEGESTSVHHEQVVGSFVDRRDEQETRDGKAILKTFGRSDLGGADLSFAVLSVAHQGHAVVMSAWAPVNTVPPATLEAMLDGLHLPSSLPETSIRDGRFRDHRFGVSVEAPSSWNRRDVQPHGQGRLVEWTQGSRELSLLMMSSSTISDDEAWVASFMEQSMRDMLARKKRLGKPEPSTGVIDGRPSRRLVYSDVQVEIVVEGNTLTMLIMAGASDETMTDFRSSLRWNDE